MRALFLALILANLVFFFWEYTLAPEQQRTAPPAAEQAEDNVPPLVLLKDNEKPATAPRPKPSAKAAPKAPVPADTEPVPPPVAKREAPAKKSEAMVCYIAGPFDHADAARAAVTVFKAKGLEAEFERRQAEKNRYWLHTPVLPSRKAALARMKEIEGRGVHDVALMRSGDFENSISLGFYYNDSSANRRLAALKARQVEAAMEIEHRTIDTYWARYKAPKDSSAAADAWKTITASHAHVQREGLPCR